MYMDLVRLGAMVLFVTSVAFELSVWRVDRGWGQPILTRFWCMGGHILGGDEYGC